MTEPSLIPEWAAQLLANARAYGALMEAYRRAKREKAAVVAGYVKAQKELAAKDAEIAELERVIVKRLKEQR